MKNIAKENPKFLVIDLFCGFGGTTLGFKKAKYKAADGKMYPIAKVIACVNHDANAITSHWLNNKNVKHFEEDIRTLNLKPLLELLNKYRAMYPNAKVILWASLECTNFSKAKGGMARDADSRTLADSLYMVWDNTIQNKDGSYGSYVDGDSYIQILNPDYIQIENVVEFMAWGPLNENGKPISMRNGEDFKKWCANMCSYGYNVEWKEMNSANYGAYTIRNRLFGCFAKIGLPIQWPNPTHAKKPVIDMFQNLKKWKAVKDVLDFSDEGESIFNRKKPLVERSLERIYAGLVKFVANGSTSFITQRNSGKPSSKIVDIDNPARTITSTGGNQSLVQSKFLDYYYGTSCTSGMDMPCKTLTTKDRVSLIQPEYFIYRDFNSVTNTSIDSPVGSITTVPKMNLIECKKIHYLMNPQYKNPAWSIEKPCFTLIARMDKAPPYLIETETGGIAIAVYSTDSPMTIKIKEFMAMHGLIDIKMRMLRVSELLSIQGFPKDYKMKGTQTHKKKFIGNSVVPNVVEAWCMAMAA